MQTPKLAVKTPVTLLEPQHLLLNTADGGTGLGACPTKVILLGPRFHPGAQMRS